MGVGATTSTGATEQGCAAADCEVATAAAPGAARITSTGVGGVRLGRTYTSLRRVGLLSKLVPGCELGGPQTRSATLAAPLWGSVDLTLRSPRRVAAILVRGGAAARGVGIGATSRRSARRSRAPDSTIAATRCSA
jgi:hypothetical protein